MRPTFGIWMTDAKFKVASTRPTLARQGESHSHSSRSLLCIIKSWKGARNNWFHVWVANFLLSNKNACYQLTWAMTFPRQRSAWRSDSVIRVPFKFFDNSSSANLMAYRRSAPVWCKNASEAVNRKVMRRRNNERKERNGWMIDWTIGRVPVADRNKIIEHSREWEKRGQEKGLVDQKAK